jgi:hypothetical protein
MEVCSGSLNIIFLIGIDLPDQFYLNQEDFNSIYFHVKTIDEMTKRNTYSIKTGQEQN